MRTRVLVTGGGGPAAIAFFEAIRSGPFDIFMADVDPHAAGLYLVPASRRLLIPRGDSRGFTDTMLGICRARQIDLLVPTVDCELFSLAEHALEFAHGGTILLAASTPTLRMCLDKWELIQACIEIAAVPRSALLDAHFTSDTWKLPVVVKPRRGSGSRGVRLLSSWSELYGLPTDGTLLVQEYLPGEEYSVDVLADPADGTVVAAVPRARLKVDSGVAVTSRTVRDTGLEGAARAICKRVGLTFVGNIQFRRDGRGDPVLLEVNPRFPGTMSLTVASGINMPRLAVEAALGRPLVDGPYPFRDVAVVRTWHDHYFSPDELLSAGLAAVGVR